MNDRPGAGDVDQSTIVAFITDTLEGVNVIVGTEGIAAGDTFFIYDPERNLQPKQQVPFATIVTKDYGDFDKSSNLDRPGVFRLNVGVSRDTFRSLFPAPYGPNEASPGYDFTALDTLSPHPFYAPQSWVCVLNPSVETFERTLKPLLIEAHQRVARGRR